MFFLVIIEILFKIALLTFKSFESYEPTLSTRTINP